MSLEGWKALFDAASVILLFLTFVSGAGALFISNRINVIQTKELEDFRLRIEGEQQKTAKVQREAAEAQLALRKYVDNVAAHQRPRLLDFKKFVASLKDKPKSTITILYSPNDSEAYTFAGHIRRGLGSGTDGDGAGWEVSAPVPIPAEGGYSHSDLAKAPPAMKYGAWYGLGILTSDAIDGHQPFWEDKSALGALTMAFIDNGFAPVSHFGVTSIPRGELVVVVGQKQ